MEIKGWISDCYTPTSACSLMIVKYTSYYGVYRDIHTEAVRFAVLTYTHNLRFEQNKKNITIFRLKITNFSNINITVDCIGVLLVGLNIFI